MKNNIFKRFINLFAQISCMIFLFSSIYIAMFYGTKASLDIFYVWGILFIAFVASLAQVPFFLEKVYSKTFMILANITYLVFINVVVVLTGFYLKWFNFEDKKLLIGFEITFFLVYGVLMLLFYSKDLCFAKKMNEKLKKRFNS